MSFKHVPVLLEPTIEALEIKTDGIYLDATFGRGGHSRAILQKLGANGHLYAIDRDLTAIESAKEITDSRFSITHSAFSKLKEVCDSLNITGKVDGILMDIGVSSPQLDDGERGFSFDKDGPLDMRMDRTSSFSAKTIIDTYSQSELAYIFKVYGEEKFANRVASTIVRYRETEDIVSTKRLANIIAGAIPGKVGPKHKATRCFQALRIEVNHELDELKTALNDALDVLSDNGLLCVITFHSLEDRIVKHFYKEKSQGPDIPRGLPITDSELEKLKKEHAKLTIVGKAIKASEQELSENIRSRSATLRVARRNAR